MELRERPIIRDDPNLTQWLFELRQKMLDDYTTLNLSITTNINSINSLSSKWCADGDSGNIIVGMAVYFSAANTVKRADGSDKNKKTRGFCTEISDEGKILVSFVGPIDVIPLESGVSVTLNKPLWLSVTEPGKATGTRPKTGIRQRIAFTIENGTGAGGTVDGVASIADAAILRL